MNKAGSTQALDHRTVAIELNQRAWALLEKQDRTLEDNDELLHAAHASLWHWLQVGTKRNEQRGLWLVGRVHVLQGNKEAAMRYAKKTMTLTTSNEEDMVDFDHAYAYELFARATFLAGEKDKAEGLFERASRLGQLIHGEQNRKIFFSDLEAIPYPKLQVFEYTQRNSAKSP
ncbi:hypothetical protein PsAD2_00060 [Pseudovibrio axinellae]|uniref:Tetratricopeptide repeat protein n=1 Tax=Pseudovibrio axinellae TaxID=989403 RepID=A0A166B963_9HYPH|nr:hypothetical protein [Pseudovibrio axinellae]KZL22035.1 hypothetical protein PsAD2_00060 [Pseudovibrio axinellae]SEQ57771.1 hypothetical protein SAMN05421798_103140 [Pseudovibrio axinellae]